MRDADRGTAGRPGPLLYSQNGEPLPLDHGFPVMVVPGLYGYVSATKWLSKLELTTFADYDAYCAWGWAASTDQDRLTHRPTPGRGTDRRPYVVAGVAWAQHRGISTVGTGGRGPVATATLGQWRRSTRGDCGRGGGGPRRVIVLEVRATGNAGEVQTDKIAPPAPDGDRVPRDRGQGKLRSAAGEAINSHAGWAPARGSGQGGLGRPTSTRPRTRSEGPPSRRRAGVPVRLGESPQTPYGRARGHGRRLGPTGHDGTPPRGLSREAPRSPSGWKNCPLSRPRHAPLRCQSHVRRWTWQPAHTRHACLPRGRTAHTTEERTPLLWTSEQTRG
jgi:hypothetical protein